MIKKPIVLKIKLSYRQALVLLQQLGKQIEKHTDEDRYIKEDE